MAEKKATKKAAPKKAAPKKKAEPPRYTKQWRRTAYGMPLTARTSMDHTPPTV